MLTRNMSYIKPLTGGLGPKQTKCELKDEMVYLDYNDYITMLTTTRTPDVPSGNVFSVKTRTCLTWASSVSSRIVVTTQVEWTGRSFIKGEQFRDTHSPVRPSLTPARYHRAIVHRRTENIPREPGARHARVHFDTQDRICSRR